MAGRGVPHRRARAVAAAVAAAAAIVTAAAAGTTAAADLPSGAWEFFGPRGPAFWGAVSPTCATGLAQSPIDVVATAPAGPLSLQSVATQDDGAELRAEGARNGVRLACASPGACGVAVWAGYTYDLVRVHLHGAVEHTMGGEVFPAELQLVHQADDGNSLVVAIHLRVGAVNEGLEKLLAASAAGAPANATATLSEADWAALVPAEDGWCQYGGSLTAPPCTEGVTWAIASTPRSASEEQLRRLGAAILDAGAVVLTKRPVQPLNGRRVTCYSAE